MFKPTDIYITIIMALWQLQHLGHRIYALYILITHLIYNKTRLSAYSSIVAIPAAQRQVTVRWCALEYFTVLRAKVCYRETLNELFYIPNKDNYK